MRKTMMLVAVVVLVGCGGPVEPTFPGVYDGMLSETDQCDIISGGTFTSSAHWQVQVAGADATVIGTNDCQPFTGAINGPNLSLDAKSCPPSVQQGVTFTRSITSGLFRLTPNGDLVVSYSGQLTLSSATAPSAHCAQTTSATLLRQ